MYKRQIALSDK